MLLLIPIAFISGFLTVLSPCVIPILPIVLSSGVDGKKARVHGVILGLLVSFTVAALFLTSLLSLFDISADALRNTTAIILFVIGYSIIFPIWEKIQPKIESLFNFNVSSQREGFFGGALTGLGLGLVWTPCVGPIVAVISSLAATEGISLSSIILVFSYALGISIPLWGIALKGSSFSSKLAVFKSNPILVRKVFGVVLVLTSVFIYFGFEKKLQSWFLDTLPENWTNIASVVEDRFDANSRLKFL